MELLIFCVIWLITFWPSWKLLLILIAWSASDKASQRRLTYFALFLEYRFLIAAPYIYLVIAGKDALPAFIRSFIVGFVLFAFMLSALRFFFKGHLMSWLWNAYAFVYDGLLYFYPYTELLDKMTDHSHCEKRDKVLDLGCGTGNLSLRLANREPTLKIDAVDKSHQMISVFKKKLSKPIEKLNINIMEADLMDLLKQVSDDTYDVIVLSNVLYTIQDRQVFWRHIVRVMKPGGRTLITNSDKTGSWPLITQHIKEKGILSLLRPKLIAVFVVDALISELSKTGTFSFITFPVVETEIMQSGGRAVYHERCYGGEKKGVNILFSVFRIE